MKQIDRRTPMPKYDFSKVCKATLLKSYLYMGVLLSLYRIFSEHDFSKDTSGRLLLRYHCKDRKKRESKNQQKILYSSRKRYQFQKVDGFQKKLIWGTIYNFYENKAAPTIDVSHKKLKEISTGTHYDRTTLYHLQKDVASNIKQQIIAKS